MASSFFRLFIGQGVLCACVSSLIAASATATLTGSVTDSSGAVVPGALVRLHQVAGSGLLTAAAGQTGTFSISGIAPSEYLLDASAPGFSIVNPQTLRLHAGETRNVAVQLTVTTVKTEVSVTGASEPQTADQISKALDVVRAADAEQRGIFSVADALRFVPGLRVSTRGSPGTFTTVQTRGGREQDTAVLIDGFRFRDPTAIQGDASAYIGDLMLVDSSRIEVLRGSGSSMYGTNSMSGTLNIITNQGGGPVHGDIDVQGGGLGLFRGVAQVAGGVFHDWLTYSAALSHLNVTEGVEDAGAVRNWSGQGGVLYAIAPNMRVGVDLFANTACLQENVSPVPTATAPMTGIIPAVPLVPSRMQLADQNLPYNAGNATFIPSLGDPDAGHFAHFIDSLFRFEHEVNSHLSYRIGYAIVDTDRNDTDGPAGPNTPFSFQQPYNTVNQNAGRTDTVQARVNYVAASHQVLTAGYEFEEEHYANTNSEEYAPAADNGYFKSTAVQRSNAVFGQDELRLLNGRLDILVSGRFTDASLSAPALLGAPSAYTNAPLPTPPAAYTGDASIAYFLKSTSTKIRAHVGNSFRLPSLYERFGQYVYFGVDYAYGNPRLAPERAVSGDFGFDQYLFHDQLKITSTYFYSRLQQVISFEDFPPGYTDPYGRSAGYYNTGGGISRGVEVSGEFRPSRKTTVRASYTYTNTKDETSQYFTGMPWSPLQTPRILPNSVSIIATQQFGKHVDLGMDFYGGSDYLLPLYGFEGYAYRFAGPRQLGLDGGYTLIFRERQSARFYFRVSNTLNQNFFEDGFETPRRWAVAGIHYNF